MKVRDLTCKNCGAPLDIQALHPQRDWIQCHYCGTVMDLRPLRLAEEPAHTTRRPPVAMPESIIVEALDDGLRITCKPNASGAGLILILLLFFPMFFFFLPIFYIILARLVNTTTILVQAGWLRTEYGPLPWPNSIKQYRIDEVEQLYCKEKITHGEHGEHQTYEVHALLAGNRSVKLVMQLKEPEQALYIEQEIERYLRILDRPVAHEMVR